MTLSTELPAFYKVHAVKMQQRMPQNRRNLCE
jgi:hypothetical protein